MRKNHQLTAEYQQHNVEFTWCNKSYNEERVISLQYNLHTEYKHRVTMSNITCSVIC